jgi:predicted secreted protein
VRISIHGLHAAKYLVTVVFFFIAVHVCLAANESRDMKNENSSTIIQKEQNGHRFTMPLNSLIDIDLPFIGSAGYGWHIENLDTDHLELILEDTQKITEPGKVGGAVMGIWCFRTIKPGRTVVKMNYYRAWEGVDTSTDHFTVEIVIK